MKFWTSFFLFFLIFNKRNIWTNSSNCDIFLYNVSVFFFFSKYYSFSCQIFWNIKKQGLMESGTLDLSYSFFSFLINLINILTNSAQLWVIGMTFGWMIIVFPSKKRVIYEFFFIQELKGYRIMWPNENPGWWWWGL